MRYEAGAQTRERNIYIDVLKGWTIALVVFGHGIQRAAGMGIWPWPTTGVDASLIPRILAAASNSMPLFLCISGYLAFGRVRRPMAGWIISKARLLLIPWASWTLVYYALVHDKFIPTGMSLPEYLRAQILAPALWYLVVLFLCYVALVLGLEVGEWALPVLGLLIVLLPLQWMPHFPSVLPLLKWYWWWFIAGYFLARFRAELAASGWLGRAAVVAVAAVGLFAPLGPSGGVRSLVIMGLSAGLVSTLIAWAIMRTPAQRLFAYMGVHSLEIYVGQFLFIWILLVRSPANAALTAIMAVAGSLALGYLLRSNRVTDALFLGGKRLPYPKMQPRTAVDAQYGSRQGTSASEATAASSDGRDG